MSTSKIIQWAWFRLHACADKQTQLDRMPRLLPRGSKHRFAKVPFTIFIIGCEHSNIQQHASCLFSTSCVNWASCLFSTSCVNWASCLFSASCVNWASENKDNERRYFLFMQTMLWGLWCTALSTQFDIFFPISFELCRFWFAQFSVSCGGTNRKYFWVCLYSASLEIGNNRFEIYTRVWLH